MLDFAQPLAADNGAPSFWGLKFAVPSYSPWRVVIANGAAGVSHGSSRGFLKGRSANTPLMLLMRAVRKLSSVPALRRKFLRSLPPNTYLLADGAGELFVVNSSDRVIGKHLYSRGQYDLDKAVTALRLAQATNDFTFVDVGANIGPICIPLVKRGLVSKAVAIEPEPTNFRFLSANILLNDVGDRVITHAAAAGDQKDQWLDFELSEANLGDHRVRVGDDPGAFGEEARRTIRVRSTTLDDLLTDIDLSKTMIWIDVQGFEGFVLRGARAALAARTPIALEFWPYGMARAGSYEALKEAIVGAGYTRLYDLSTLDMQPVTVQTLDRLYNELTGDCSADILVMA